MYIDQKIQNLPSFNNKNFNITSKIKFSIKPSNLVESTKVLKINF